MGITEKEFGKTEKGELARLYTIQNSNGMKAVVSDFGAVLVSLLVPDKDGTKQDVVWGYDTVAGYEHNNVYLGATIGRNANRIGNARFHIGSLEYQLEKNDGNNNLHGGFDGYHARMWSAVKVEDNAIAFRLESPDGDQGFPGNVLIEVKYTLTSENELQICYDAVSNENTILNMTNHSYFNLNGADSDSVLEHQVWIDADAFTEADAQSIPTGVITAVEGTPMDFREYRRIGQDIDADYEQLKFGHGYDHNWVLNNEGNMAVVAKLRSEKSGITMEVSTDLPGMQLYTGNFLNGEKGKNGKCYTRRSAACFETQYFPDAVNRSEFISPVYKAGQAYKTTTGYKFLVE